MSAHKFWEAFGFTPATPGTVELSEFHLYSGATRVDAAATLTASEAPSSGALANLKDDAIGTLAYWSSGGELLRLRWEFASATAVDGIVLGTRTTIARYPRTLVLAGGDTTTESSGAPVFSRFYAVECPAFASAAKTGVLALQPWLREPLPIEQTLIDHLHPGGVGRVPYEVVEEVLPRTDPKTYRPQWAKVRLERDIDGRVIREEWSDRATGAGVFEHVDENYTYTLTAIYPDSGMRAVIADRIKPENYPEPEAPAP